jgi:hypothetical protein
VRSLEIRRRDAGREWVSRSFHVDGVRVGDLQPIIRENLSREARLMTDEMWSYREIGREFAAIYETINHKKEEYVLAAMCHHEHG